MEYIHVDVVKLDAITSALRASIQPAWAICPNTWGFAAREHLASMIEDLMAHPVAADAAPEVSTGILGISRGIREGVCAPSAALALFPMYTRDQPPAS